MIETPEKERAFDPNQLMRIDLIKTPVETKHLQRDAFSVSTSNPSVSSMEADLSSANNRIICHEDFPRILALLNQLKQPNEPMDYMILNQVKKMNEPTEDMLQKSIRHESEATAQLMKESSGFNNLTIHRGDCPITDRKMQGYLSILIHRLKLKTDTPVTTCQTKTTREEKAEKSEKKIAEKRKRATCFMGDNTEDRKTFTSPSSTVTTGRDKTLIESISRSGTISNEKQCNNMKKRVRKDSIASNVKSPLHLSVVFP